MTAKINDFREARNAVGSVEVDDDGYPGDNLAIALCSYFETHPDRPNDDQETDHGWGEWVEQRADEVLAKIVRTLRPDLP